MLPPEYERMAAVENDHWWYRGTRDLMTRLLQQRRQKIAYDARAVDAGCGTGANLQLLSSVLKPQTLSGFDIADQAVEYARQKAPSAVVTTGDLCHPPTTLGRIDVLLCVDVLYMTGLEDARPGLQTLVGQLSSGGWLILHVPAYDWLYSRHDVAVGTRRRFSRTEVRRLLTELGLSIELLTYRVSLLFPLIVMARLPSLLAGTKRPSAKAVVSDLAMPPRWLNSWLLIIVKLENWLIAQGVRFPCGSSIIALGRKP